MIYNKKKLLLTTTSVITLLTIWKISALFIGADVLLPPPEAVFKSLYRIATTEHFLQRLSSTFIRGIIGFILSMVTGVIVGIFAGVFKTFRTVVTPLISVIRATPVISVILLALIWFNVDYVPIFVAFLMAFPIVCGNIIEGVTTVDQNLLEMAKSYSIPIKKQIFEIYIPSTIPFIIASASLSLGIIWKVVVAAEVLSQPKWGVGTSLNEAKAFIITEEVFAWTVVVILLNAITEYAFGKLQKRIPGRNQ